MMMRVQERSNARGYNEVIVSSAYWDAHLPEIIEAFVFVGDSTRAAAAHAAFIEAYPALRPPPPLVHYTHAGFTAAARRRL